MPDRLLFSDWLYEMLLHLYPKTFRAAYSQQMRLTFRAACRTAYHRNGAAGLLALWLPPCLTGSNRRSKSGRGKERSPCSKSE